MQKYFNEWYHTIIDSNDILIRKLNFIIDINEELNY